MKYDLDWHKVRLRNRRHYFIKKLQEVEALQHRLVQWLKEDAFYSEQIAQAELHGKYSFDAEKFLKNRRREFGL